MRPRTSTRLVIAVINTSDDLVAAVRERLLDEGFEVVTGHVQDIKSGRTDFSAFIRAHRPAAVIYDVALPYEDNWTFLNMLRSLPDCADLDFLITTVNKRVLDERVGGTDAIELVGGHADDLEPLVEALCKLVK